MYPNPYFPTGYPYGGQNTPQYTFQQAPQVPATMAQAQTSNAGNQSILWVRGFREALEYPLAPNAAVALWDQNSPTVYLKTADAAGKPTTKVYDLVERKEDPAPMPGNRAAAATEYAPQKAVDALEDKIAEIVEEIKRLKEDRENG